VKRSLEQKVAGVARALRQHLEYQMEWGLEGVYREQIEAARRKAAGAGGARRNPADELRRIREEIGECGDCRLKKGRTNLVFGEGDPYADLMFVGEAPGADEDAQGRPFVGRAGQLLTDVIQKGMKLDRNRVYITNVVKCRPPDNRDPEPEEIEACLPVLVRQIETVRPKVIVALGRVAAHALTGAKAPITRLRGQWHEFRGISLMPTFHPSYLLRNPKAKRDVWEDVKQVMKKLNLPLPDEEG